MNGKAIFTVIMLLVCLGSATDAPASAEAAEGKRADSAAVADLLNSLGRNVSGFRTLKTEFRQEKELALFQDKLVLKGRIYLQKPDKIAWHVDHPVRYSVLITERMIRQWDAETNKVREISLTGNPVFRSVLGQLTVWFSGEYATLLKDYTVKVIQKDPVVLECSPRDASTAGKVIKSITLAFREDRTYLQTIRIFERTGDTTTITFLNTVLNPRLDDDSFEVRPVRELGSGTVADAPRQLSCRNPADSNREAFSDGVNAARDAGRSG